MSNLQHAEPLPTPHQILSLSLAIGVEDAALILGIGRNAAYEAVKRGDIPSIRIGQRIVVPTAPLRKMLGLDGKVEAARAEEI